MFDCNDIYAAFNCILPLKETLFPYVTYLKSVLQLSVSLTLNSPDYLSALPMICRQ